MEHQTKSDKNTVPIANANFVEKSSTTPFFVPSAIQPKLRVSPPDDPLEKEADAVADRVTAMPDVSRSQLPPFFTPAANALQRKCAHCEEEEMMQKGEDGDAMPVSRKEKTGEVTAGDNIAAALQQTKGSGAPLPENTRAHMENAIGADFSNVKIHTGTTAVQLSEQLNAHAFTYGNDIYFNQGTYSPGSQQGDKLLAHELTHVVQQNSGIQKKIQRQKKRDPEYIPFQVKVPQDYTTLEQMYRLFERVTYGKEMNLSWTCGSYCDMSKNRGQIVPFLLHKAKLDKAKGEQAEKEKQLKEDFKALPGDSQQKVNAEADKRYYEISGEHTKIKPGEKGKARTWENMRNEVLEEKKKLEELPKEIRALMGGEGTFKPGDYQQLQRIADKLKQFSPEDLAVYKMLTLRATDDLQLFEKSVDMFLARKAQLIAAMKEQQTAPKQSGPANMQEAMDSALKDLGGKDIRTMSESERYDLAAKKAWDVTKAQLEYMKDHPGETAVDFAKAATLQNTGDTFNGIGKDLQEAASGDANTWARWAGGVGAGAKLSGWMLAVGGVLYVLSWLTGVGELATIAAFMGYMLAGTVVLSTVESQLRIKAASQATTEEEFKEQVKKAGAALTNVIMAVGLLALALAIRFIAKTYFPQTVAKINGALTKFRRQVQAGINLNKVKAEFQTELTGHRENLVKAREAAKENALKSADEIEKMDTDKFIDKLESGDSDFFDLSSVKDGQKIPWKEMAKTPEGRKAIEGYRAKLVEQLRSTVLKEINATVKEQLDAIDAMMKEILQANAAKDLLKAADGYEKFMSAEEVAARGAAREKKMREDKAAEALKEFELLLKIEKIKPELLKYDPIRKYLEANPNILRSFAEHPEAIPVLEEVMNELKTLGAEKVVEKYNGRDLREVTPLTEEQRKLSGEFEKEVKAINQTKPRQQTADLDKMYADAEAATTELSKVMDEILSDPKVSKTGGRKEMRPGLKGRERAEQKVRDEYGGDASWLVDIAGGKIVFTTLEGIYQALAVIKSKFGSRIIKVKDRFADPQQSGYRDVLMSIKMSNGHIVELRLHLEQIDKVASFEHPIYEVKRVVAPDAARAAGQLTPEQHAIALSIEARVNAIFGKAIKEVTAKPAEPIKE
ncbi:hypothetical protein SAMN05444266_101312 [Chitinophaga jiangningensis]|uniref:RelA/SpoT domain-containing protein n=1 Tax=Chitinophaga jiangningensis TaxID=1419482 RepID=A0A1M6VQQ1_9BACT|nr:DUF4157 domain-containing protein [Chitinophaga jiangningensis]SHK83665.1 hypothetical protein SAMN05444266_101312 [Chitinophaga jiangningensis]